MNTIKKIEKQIQENPVLIYIKGTPDNPSCGFSSQAIAALKTCSDNFSYVDILQHPDIRKELPKYSDWPTFPQLWVSGKLIGGCNIILEMVEKNELKKIIDNAFKKIDKI